MSGFEIAGIVLGAFPILQDAAKGLRTVFGDVKTWWRFETEFEVFIATVETEHIKYSQNLEILLGDIDISEEDREKLQKDSTCCLWSDPPVQAQLRKKIRDPYYGWFMRQLNDINTALIALHEILTQGKMYHLNTKSLESEMFKVKASFSHEKDRLVAQIKTRNDTLYDFLARASHIERTTTQSIPAKPSKAEARPPLAVKETANETYQCFQRHLKCNCPSTHPCGITVTKIEKEGGKTTVCMKLLFLEQDARTQVKVERIPMIHKKPPGLSHSESSKLEDVAALQQQFAMKNRVGDVQKSNRKSIFALAASSLSLSSRKADKMEGKLSKPKIKRRWGSSSSNIKVEDPTSRETRVVRFADQDVNKEEDDPLPDPFANVAAINNLCITIRQEYHDACLGYLESSLQDRLMLSLDPADQRQSPCFNFETFEAFLSSTPRRDTRIKVGYNLALVIINLGGSSWIPQLWNKTDVLLVRYPGSSMPQPYLNHSSLRQTLAISEEVPAAKKARLALFALGVLLLELLFRETIENQPFRIGLMGKDGKPNETTDLATALFWQQRVEEEFGDELADAIKRCLVCMFDMAPAPDLSNAAFLQAVWQQVILPVEKFLSAWSKV